MSFEPTRDLLDTLVYPRESYHQQILTDPGNLFIFFVNAETSHVRMITSNDRGTTFSQVREISSFYSSEISSTAICGDSLALISTTGVGLPRKILRSTDHGLTWSIASGDLGSYDNDTRIALTPGKLHMVKDYAPEIVYMRSTDLGDSWDLSKMLSSNDGLQSDMPTIAGFTGRCGSEMLLAWRDVKYGTFGYVGATILSRSGLHDGDIWLPEDIRTTEPKGFAPFAAIHQNIRAIGMAYESGDVYDTIHPAITGNNYSLVNYTPVFDLSPTAQVAGPVSVALSGHTIHLVYGQQIGAHGSCVFYRRGEYIQANAAITLPIGTVEIDSTEVTLTRRDSILVGNTGTDSLIIGTAIADNLDFSVTPASARIPAGGSVPFFINFSPTSVGIKTGKVIFYHNGLTSPDCFTISGIGKYSLDTVKYTKNGWNMVSISLAPNGYPTLPSLFSYDGTYTRRDTMEMGVGYWAKPTDSTIVYQGIRTLIDTVAVRKGWNLIGGLSAPIPSVYVYPDPDSITFQSSFYIYLDGGGYGKADTLKPGRSYWIRMSGAGALVLDARFLSVSRNSGIKRQELRPR